MAKYTYRLIENGTVNILKQIYNTNDVTVVSTESFDHWRDLLEKMENKETAEEIKSNGLVVEEKTALEDDDDDLARKMGIDDSDFFVEDGPDEEEIREGLKNWNIEENRNLEEIPFLRISEQAMEQEREIRTFLEKNNISESKIYLVNIKSNKQEDVFVISDKMPIVLGEDQRLVGLDIQGKPHLIEYADGELRQRPIRRLGNEIAEAQERQDNRILKKIDNIEINPKINEKQDSEIEPEDEYNSEIEPDDELLSGISSDHKDHNENTLDNVILTMIRFYRPGIDLRYEEDYVKAFIESTKWDPEAMELSEVVDFLSKEENYKSIEKEVRKEEEALDNDINKYKQNTDKFNEQELDKLSRNLLQCVLGAEVFSKKTKEQLEDEKKIIEKTEFFKRLKTAKFKGSRDLFLYDFSKNIKEHGLTQQLLINEYKQAEIKYRKKNSKDSDAISPEIGDKNEKQQETSLLNDTAKEQIKNAWEEVRNQSIWFRGSDAYKNMYGAWDALNKDLQKGTITNDAEFKTRLDLVQNFTKRYLNTKVAGEKYMGDGTDVKTATPGVGEHRFTAAENAYRTVMNIQQQIKTSPEMVSLLEELNRVDASYMASSTEFKALKRSLAEAGKISQTDPKFREMQQSVYKQANEYIMKKSSNPHTGHGKERLAIARKIRNIVGDRIKPENDYYKFLELTDLIRAPRQEVEKKAERLTDLNTFAAKLLGADTISVTQMASADVQKLTATFLEMEMEHDRYKKRGMENAEKTSFENAEKLLEKGEQVKKAPLELLNKAEEKLKNAAKQKFEDAAKNISGEEAEEKLKNDIRNEVQEKIKNVRRSVGKKFANYQFFQKTVDNEKIMLYALNDRGAREKLFDQAKKQEKNQIKQWEVSAKKQEKEIIQEKKPQKEQSQPAMKL